MTDRKTPEQLAEILYSAFVEPCEWVHVKSGVSYMAIATTLREEDLTPLVIYAPKDPRHLGPSITFARPVTEFREKFRQVGF